VLVRHDGATLLVFLLRRLALAVVSLLIIAAIDYAMFDFPHGLDRAFLHLDFGIACSYPGCPKVSTLWGRMWPTDLYLLFGGLAIGVVAGFAGAVFCATRPRSPGTRAIESVAVLFYSLPVYLFGFGLLYLFEPSFGLLPLPVFFHPEDYAPPLENPWHFFEGMLVPWLLVAAPFAAVVLRLAQAAMVDVLDSDYVRTASAKGLPRGQVVGRHAGRPASVATASLIGVWVPAFVTNMVLVEYVFFTPGFFSLSRRAFGQAQSALGSHPDIPMVQGLALWAAVLTVVISALSDVVLIALDPRVRSAALAPRSASGRSAPVT
jgi:peptide/nickel transport system permease protein